MLTTHATAGLSSAAVAFAAAWALISPPPTVEVRSLLLDPETRSVVYAREVHGKANVRAPIRNEILRADDERPVVQCMREDWAFFQVDESTVKNFAVDFFFGPECSAALEFGTAYVAVTTVIPLDGRPSQMQSNTFVWGAGQRGIPPK